jgi:hypothetical protein
MVVDFDDEGRPIPYFFTFDASKWPDITLRRGQCCRNTVSDLLF